MLRRFIGLMIILTVMSLTLAQEPTKPGGKAKPADPAFKPKAGPNPEQMVDMILQRMDTNKDGKISKSEAQGRIADNFDRIDTNKDGYLDRSELLVMARRMIQMQGAGGPPGPGGPFAGQRPDPNDFDALDKNADGRLTREELKGTPYADKFDEIDTNKDGKIDRKEFSAYFRREAEKKQQTEKKDR